MNIQKKFGHFGDIELAVVREHCVLILLKAPTKYHVDGLADDDKTKSDVVFVCIDSGWVEAGALPHNPEGPDHGAIEDQADQVLSNY